MEDLLSVPTRRRRGAVVVLAVALGLLAGACSVGFEVSGAAQPDAPDAPPRPSFPDSPATPTPRPEPSDTGPPGAPDLSLLAEARAPGGLGDVDLPRSPPAVRALMRRLPAEVAGLFRVDADVSAPPELALFEEVIYMGGSGGTAAISLHVEDLARGQIHPADWRAGHVVAQLGQGFVLGAGPTGARSGPPAGYFRDGDLIWARGLGAGNGPGAGASTMHVLTWGAIDGRWLFFASTETPRQYHALAAAFAAAAAEAG